ncbi:MAG TPA: choice-of-anchor Q domain-containing protein [Herpetosiphonaceae bacterium]
MITWLRLGLIALFVVGLAISRPAHAATLTVTTTADELNNDGDCSLREAIRSANLNTQVDNCLAGTSTDTINIPAGMYLLTLAGIDEDMGALGDLDLLGNLTLNGAGIADTIIDGNARDRVFDIMSGAQVQLTQLTIRNGYAAGSDTSVGSGGGLRTSGTATLTDVRLQNNRAGGEESEYVGFPGRGGGIANQGTLTLVDTQLVSNRAGGSDPAIDGSAWGQGGGIFNSGTLIMQTSTVEQNESGGGSDPGEGGGIFNTGSLTMNMSRVLNNEAVTSVYGSGGRGGGIANDGGTVTATATHITANEASGAREGTGSGGGIANLSGAMQLITSMVDQNYVYGGYGARGGEGGGIFNLDQLTLERSTIAHNRAGAGYSMGTGGGIYNEGTLTIANSTISHNESDGNGEIAPGIGGGIGGGIATSGTLHLNNTTIHANKADNYPGEPPGQGAGLFVEGGTATIRNSIIAGNLNGDPQRPECAGTLLSEGYNLIQSTIDCTITGDLTGNLPGVDPQLGPLQDNGGPTPTHAPFRGSPAVDAGNAAAPGSGENACAPSDQRGVERPQDGSGDGVARCDIGAVECTIASSENGLLACVYVVPLSYYQYLPLIQTPTPKALRSRSCSRSLCGSTL